MFRVDRRHTLWQCIMCSICLIRPAVADEPGESPMPVLQAEFSQHVNSDSLNGDRRAGVLHVAPDGNWRIDYFEPMQQTLIATDTMTVILYPLTLQGIRIHAAMLEPPSLLFFIVRAVASNEDLARSGLQLVDFRASGDTTITVWQIEGCTDSHECGRLALHRVGMVITRMDSFLGNSLKHRFSVRETGEFFGLSLPKVVRSERWYDNNYEQETVNYESISLLECWSDDLFSPVFPEGYQVAERSW